MFKFKANHHHRTYLRQEFFYHQRDTQNQRHTMEWNSFTAGWRPPTYFVFGLDFIHHSKAKYKTRAYHTNIVWTINLFISKLYDYRWLYILILSKIILLIFHWDIRSLTQTLFWWRVIKKFHCQSYKMKFECTFYPFLKFQSI